MPRNLKRAEDTTLLELQRNNQIWEVIKTLVNGGTDESRLLELYYWSQEPGVVELIRAYLAMDERARLTLGNFMLTAWPQSIVASTDRSGNLVLSQIAAAKAQRDTRQTTEH